MHRRGGVRRARLGGRRVEPRRASLVRSRRPHGRADRAVGRRSRGGDPRRRFEPEPAEIRRVSSRRSGDVRRRCVRDAARRGARRRSATASLTRGDFDGENARFAELVDGTDARVVHGRGDRRAAHGVRILGTVRGDGIGAERRGRSSLVRVRFRRRRRRGGHRVFRVFDRDAPRERRRASRRVDRKSRVEHRRRCESDPRARRVRRRRRRGNARARRTV